MADRAIDPQQTPRLTVVLTNYNGRGLLETMLPSLARQSYRDFAIVVVDDGSSDGSVSYLRERWPDVDVIELPGNGGVTAAMDVGLRAPSSELVALFNNDMELDPNCLAALVAALDSHPEAGSATPKMLDFSDRRRIDGAG
ncbi:MAG TPA: glycosyltransferase, partial [Solirubrobacteraceae bacterium]|nr:glycosyltransferase [Solirubrobacteraceae bacterium]